MGTRKVFSAFILSIAVILTMADVQAADEFASPTFAQQWQHDEQLVPNFWGPLANAHAGQYEQYRGSGMCPANRPCNVVPVDPMYERRLVQYFDKGRMELTIGGAGGPAVTAGLLVREMITGQVQVGDTRFAQQPPAAIPVAGDADNTFPLYRDLASGAVVAPTISIGAPVQLLLTPAGASTTMAAATDPNTVGSERDDPTDHVVPRAFAALRARIGVDAIGLAVTEPFWADVKIAGSAQRVMLQAFERRVLTYNPANPPPFQVESGNAGQHYDAWRTVSDV